MKPNLLVLPLLVAAQMVNAQAPIQVGGTFQIDHFGSGSRGTDTLYTLGIEQAVTAAQIAGYTTPGGGMLFGPSEFPATEFAQEFELLDGPVNVDGIVFFFAQHVYGSSDPTSHVKARLYAMNAAGGLTSTGTANRPGTVLAEEQLAISDIVAQDFSGVSFAPQWISSSFAVGFSLNGLNTADSVNLAASTTGYVEMSDRSWLFLGAWATVLFATTDPGTPGSGSNIDYFVGAVITPSSVNVNENAWLNGMQMTLVEGNPVQGQLTVQYNVRESATMSMRVFDAMGRNVVERNIGNRSGLHQEVLDTGSWTPGVYYVNMLANGRPITKKVVVQ